MFAICEGEKVLVETLSPSFDSLLEVVGLGYSFNATVDQVICILTVSEIRPNGELKVFKKAYADLENYKNALLNIVKERSSGFNIWYTSEFHIIEKFN